MHRNALIEYANPAFAIMFAAKSATELLGQPVPALVPATGRDEFRGQIARLDGVTIHVETKSINITFDGMPAFYVVARDITARRKAEAIIQRLAYFDDLTGLPNRRLFMDRIAGSLNSAMKSRQFGALLFLDLDNFKHLNDARGHALGDRLLIEVSKRVGEVLQPQDTSARLGGIRGDRERLGYRCRNGADCCDGSRRNDSGAAGEPVRDRGPSLFGHWQHRTQDRKSTRLNSSHW